MSGAVSPRGAGASTALRYWVTSHRSGHLPLREALLRHLAVGAGIDAAVDQVMIVNSTMQAMELCARVLIDRGDVVWLEDPGYPNLRSTFVLAGARVAFVPVDGEGLDVDHGARVGPAPALVCVTPACQYPTGVRMSLARRLALLRCAERAAAWIVEDDYQSEFTYDGRPVTSLASLDRAERVIHIGTFTNSVFPSLRLAYAVLPRALVPGLRRRAPPARRPHARLHAGGAGGFHRRRTFHRPSASDALALSAAARRSLSTRAPGCCRAARRSRRSSADECRR
jgi:DNA-binding transcriptional MocR family regulator